MVKSEPKRQRGNSAGQIRKEKSLEGLLQGMSIGEDSLQESNNCNSGERGDGSSIQSLTATKLKEEQSLCSSLFCNRAPAGPPLVSSSQESISFEESEEVHVCAKLSNKSRKIAKASPSAARIQRPRRAATTTTRPPRTIRENYHKFTVKTVSNFLRQELKKRKFDFSRLESKDKNKNKRGSRIYFNSALLELKHLLGSKFSAFIGRYLNDLDRRILELKNMQEKLGRTERRQSYIEDFESAKDAIPHFMRGNYVRSIKTFFGKGKEKFYYQQSIKYFTERKDQLNDYTLMINEDEDIFDVLAI